MEDSTLPVPMGTWAHGACFYIRYSIIPTMHGRMPTRARPRRPSLPRSCPLSPLARSNSPASSLRTAPHRPQSAAAAAQQLGSGAASLRRPASARLSTTSLTLDLPLSGSAPGGGPQGGGGQGRSGSDTGGVNTTPAAAAAAAAPTSNELPATGRDGLIPPSPLVGAAPISAWGSSEANERMSASSSSSPHRTAGGGTSASTPPPNSSSSSRGDWQKQQQTQQQALATASALPWAGGSGSGSGSAAGSKHGGAAAAGAAEAPHLSFPSSGRPSPLEAAAAAAAEAAQGAALILGAATNGSAIRGGRTSGDGGKRLPLGGSKRSSSSGLPTPVARGAGSAVVAASDTDDDKLAELGMLVSELRSQLALQQAASIEADARHERELHQARGADTELARREGEARAAAEVLRLEGLLRAVTTEREAEASEAGIKGLKATRWEEGQRREEWGGEGGWNEQLIAHPRTSLLHSGAPIGRFMVRV